MRLTRILSAPFRVVGKVVTGLARRVTGRS